MPFTDKPLVVLFGPSTAGKTAILGRMVRYLKVKGKNFNEGNSFIIDGDFITDNAGLKEVLEEQLLDFCNKSKVVIKKTSALLYALVHTTDYAILEVAGELLTSGDGTKLKDKDKGAAQIVRENVLHNPENKVISVILLDTDISDKESYVDTIKKEFTKKYVYESNVKIIFLINKFDKIKKGYGAEIGKTFEAEKWIEENFPNL